MQLSPADVYEGLLRHNFFPMVKHRRDDIPPLFTTKRFTPAIADELIAKQNSKATGKDPRGNSGYDQIEYRTTRFNNLTRLMHIPHPNPYARLSKVISQNWASLSFTEINSRSLVRPQWREGGRIVVTEDYDGETRSRIEPLAGRVIVMEKDTFPSETLDRLSLATGNRYLVEADVSSCFPTLYTHALSWALLGHAAAKKAKNDATLWANQLDFAARYLKRNETQGVPVGPGTSNILAEAILAKIDDALTQRGYRFVRAIDDYNCYVPDRVKAEEFIRDLEAELAKYLFGLNVKKVSIRDLPLPIKSDWISELIPYIPIGRKASPREVTNLLDAAVAIQGRHPEGSVVKYAARAALPLLRKENAEVFIRYLLQLCHHFPVAIPILFESLQFWKLKFTYGDLRDLTLRHLECRRSDAVGWCLCLFRLCNLKVGPKLSGNIIESHDCVPIAVLLGLGYQPDMVEQYLAQLKVIEDYDRDRVWLLAHELKHLGRKLSPDFEKYHRDSGLEVLTKHKVSFFRRVKASPTRTQL